MLSFGNFGVDRRVAATAEQAGESASGKRLEKQYKWTVDRSVRFENVGRIQACLVRVHCFRILSPKAQTPFPASTTVFGRYRTCLRQCVRSDSRPFSTKPSNNISCGPPGRSVPMFGERESTLRSDQYGFVKLTRDQGPWPRRGS